MHPFIKNLLDAGYTKEEAKKIFYKLVVMSKETKKKLITGQLITDEELEKLAQELKEK